MLIKKIIPFILFLFTSVNYVSAHCPLCTAGALVAAGGAAYFGVSNIIIGLFIGAFAVSIGWWVSRLIKKRYIPYQRFIIIALSFITTVIPLLSTLKEFYPLYISMAGDYGSLLNRTYLINLFLVGSIIGGIMVSLTPFVSKLITKLRKGKVLPFQGIIITLLALIIVGIVIQLVT